MNTYFWLAIIFSALAALMGYLGVKREGDKSMSQVRDLLNDTKGLITEAKSAGEPIAAQDVDVLEARYSALAVKFEGERPLISAQISARKASREVEQVTASAALLQPVRFFSEEATKIAKAFSMGSTRWRLEFHSLPDNIIVAGLTHVMTYGIENENISYVVTISVYGDGLNVSFGRTEKPIDYWLQDLRNLPIMNRQTIDLDTYDNSEMQIKCGTDAIDVCDLILASDEYKELTNPEGSKIPAEALGKAMVAVFLGTIRHELAVKQTPQANP